MQVENLFLLNLVDGSLVYVWIQMIVPSVNTRKNQISLNRSTSESESKLTSHGIACLCEYEF